MPEIDSAKYPRTPHFPWSPGFLYSEKHNDDKVMSDVSQMLNRDLVMTEKMDGSNGCLTRDAVYARSHNGPPTHDSYDWLKARWSGLRWIIPEQISTFVEYAMAVHSIEYTAMPSPVFLISMRSDRVMTWAAWKDIEMWARELGMPTVPLISRFRVSTIKELQDITDKAGAAPGFYGPREGVVVRVADEFPDSSFGYLVGKWVRRGHVQTDQHWAHGQWKENGFDRVG